mmetsp:Transcript_148891/g.361502  ORF Transcript_148891/g.361502 Transcript_148891/m.361502 type:complete len:597 (-) Transcript_148891:380-2170(-)
MGGASSYYSILRLLGFYVAIWIAAKASRFAGISSIVLEIATGVVLGPQVGGLIPGEYSICEWEKRISCAEGSPDLDRVVADTEHNPCDVDAYAAEGKLGSYANSSSTRRLAGGGGGVRYDTYGECLRQSCIIDLANRCQSTPNILTMIGHTGVAMMIFESGMHFDFEKAKVVGLPACCVAVLGTILPLIVGSLLMLAFGRPLMPDGISAGTALAPTSVGIALRLLGEAGVLQENFGQAIITAAFVDDILSLVLFNVLFSLGGEFDVFKTVISPIIGIAFMLIAMVGAVKFWPKVIDGMILPSVPDRRDGVARGVMRLRLEKDETLFLLQILMLVVYSLITHLLGTHLWGCFIAGMSFACLSPPHHAHHVWVKQTKRMTSWMIRIFFSCTVAFSIPVAQLMSITAFWKGSILGVFACILTKVCCAPFMGPARWVIGWAMVGRAEFAYLIAQMALSANMLDEESFSIVIWALLYATIFAPFIFRWLLNRYVKSQGLEGRGGEDGHALNNAHDEEAVSHEAHAQGPKAKKLDFSLGAELEDVDVGALKERKMKLWSDAPPPATMTPRVAPRTTPRAAVGGKGSGDGFLCCLFFKKIIVQ